MTITIDSDFPGGNIIVENIDGGHVTEAQAAGREWYVSPDKESITVFLYQDLRDTSTDWFYWYFAIHGAASRKLKFNFTQSKAIGTHGPGISFDKGWTWSWLGSDSVQDNSFVYEFPADADEVRFSFGMPYLECHLEEFLTQFESSPYLKKEILCTTRKGRNVERLHLGILSNDPDIRMLFTARHHCCEMMASYVMEGIIETILSDSETGKWFRDHAEVCIIPFVDKDGVEDGDQGKNRKPRDHNRDYDENVHVETAAIKEFVSLWSDGKLTFAMDIHCPYISGNWNEQLYFVGDKNPENWEKVIGFAETLEKVKQGVLPFSKDTGLLPYGEEWNIDKNFSQGTGFKKWALTIPDIDMVCSIEVPYANASGKEVNQGSARLFGKDVALAVKETYGT